MASRLFLGNPLKKKLHQNKDRIRITSYQTNNLLWFVSKH